MTEFFVKLMVIVLVIDVLCRIGNLGTGNIRQKTMKSEASNLLFNGIFLIVGVIAWVKS